MTISSRALLIFVLVSIVSLVSCEEKSITKAEQERIKLDKIGAYHNQALDLVYKDDDINSNDLNYSEFQDIIIDKITKKYPKRFNRTLLENKKPKINEDLIKSGLLQVNSQNKGNLDKVSFTFTGNYQSVIRYMKTNKNISQRLSSRLNELYNKPQNWFSKEDPVLFAKKKINVNSLPEADKKYANAFLSVLNASNNYWSKKSTLEKSIGYSMQSKECALAQTGADAAGALYGMIAGPAWSVIEGAIFTGVAILNCEE